MVAWVCCKVGQPAGGNDVPSYDVIQPCLTSLNNAFWYGEVVRAGVC